MDITTSKKVVTARRFYVYVYFRADGTPYYVGRGQTNRINSPDHCVKLPPVHRRKRVATDLTHEEANDWEEALVSVLGKKSDGTGCLRNLRDGGDKAAGYSHTEETKQILRQKATGRKMSVSDERRRQLVEQCRSICRSQKAMTARAEGRAVSAAIKMGLDVDRYLACSPSLRLLINKRFYQHGLRGEYLFLPENVQPRTVMAAERMGVDPLWFAGLSRGDKNIVSKRVKAGKTLEEVVAGLSI